jgi:hypothetical protein
MRSSLILAALLVACAEDPSPPVVADAGGQGGAGAGAGGAAAGAGGVAAGGGQAGAKGGEGGEGGAGSGGEAGAGAGGAGAGGAGAGGAGGEAAGLALGGEGTITEVEVDGFLHFDVDLSVTNQTGAAATLTASRMLFAHEGGYAFDLGDTIKENGSFFGLKTLSSSPKPHALPLQYLWSTPLTHAVFWLGADQGGAPLSALAAVPLLREGYSAPAPSPFAGAQNALLAVQGPVEALDLASGERWLTVVGQVTNLTAKSLAVLSLSMTLKQGDTVVLSEDLKAGLQSNAPKDTLKDFLAARALPAGFSGGELTLDASVKIGGTTTQLTRTTPVEVVGEVELAPPLQGRWLWGNGQGEDTFHSHFQYPEQRYAYDLVKLEGGATFAGDAGKNESYFAWGKPVLAAAAGVVAAVVDDVPDNNGDAANPANNPTRNAFVLIDHGDGRFTYYAHVRQGSALVKVGQQVAAGDPLAAVGNAGFSSEPHLHFACFRVDETGRPRALPMRFTGLQVTDGAPAQGAPHGKVEYVTP